MRTRSWFVSILLLLFMCCYLFYYFYSVERSRAIEGIVSHQKIHARQAARSLSELFDKWNGVLAYLSADENIIRMTDRGKQELSELRQVLRNEMKGITRVDKSGKIVYTVPFYPNSIGADISQQKHIVRIIADHKPVVSDVFDAVQGYQAIALHCPVFRNGVFDGSIAFIIDFGEVGRDILKEIETDGPGYAWMLSRDGVELYCPVPGHIGKSIRETAQGFPDLLSLADSMLAGKEGIATYTYDKVAARQQRGKKIAYFLPVHIIDTYWPLAVVYSEEDITNSLSSFGRKLIVIIGCVFIGGVFISYFGFKAWVVVKESTARKKAEEQLRESEERYRNLYTNAAIGIYRMTPEGKIVFANPHFVKMLGFGSFESLAAWSSARGRFPLSHEGQGLNDLLKGNKEVRGLESKWEKSDGTEIIVRENVRAFHNEDGSVAYYDITAEDISQQRELQSQLLQSQKMEAIGQLAGGVAHDFNNMIGVILGYAALIEKELDPSDNTYKKVQAIIKAAERSANLARQLLAFARKQLIAPIVVNLNRELVNVQKMLERLLGENVRLELVLTDSLWNVKMDPIQIDQVVTNLCTNARDAIQNIGTITVRTSNLTITDNPDTMHAGLGAGEYVFLEVTDDGCGMEPVTMEKIYEPFFSTKPKGKGTGLGLATVFGIVQQNNGAIEVESEKDKGTTFRIYLPRFLGEVEVREEVTDDVPSTGTGTILVVEDEEEMLSLIGSSLNSLGYTTLCTTSPGNALKLCRESKGRLDLLITDVIMPEMNGKQLQEKVEEICPGIKTLFISGYTADVVAERGILEKETMFLQKPFSPAMLVKKVQSILAG